MNVASLAAFGCALTAAAAVAATPATPRPFTPDDVLRIARVSTPALSPDGAHVAYTLATVVPGGERRSADVWVVPTAGGPEVRLTTSPASDHTPRWSPDGRWLGFLSSRSGETQVWRVPFGSGGEAERLTDAPRGVEDFHFTPDGAALVYAARTHPGCPDAACVRAREAAARADDAPAAAGAVVHDDLPYRRWDAYDDGTVQHLFVQPVAGGEPRDLTPELTRDALVFWLLAGPSELALSPDGRWVYFAGDQDAVPALSFNPDLWRVPTDGGGPPERLTTSPAADQTPRPSPDGRRLAYRATRRPGHDADRFEPRLLDLDRPGEVARELAPGFDRSVAELLWAPDGRTLYLLVPEEGDLNVYAVAADGDGPPRRVAGPERGGHGYRADLAVTPDGAALVHLATDVRRPWELRVTPLAGSQPVRILTHANDALLAEAYFPEAEEVWYEGAGGTRVQGFLLRPRGWAAADRREAAWPLLVRIHGGPQQMFGHALRPEYPLFAGAGYFVFFANPRGSTGYGQAFSDEVRGAWDGAVVDDLRAGVRHVLAHEPTIDPRRAGAWGDSFGGWLVNWLQGHDDERLFAAFAAHAASAERWTAWGTTDELWFPEWELGGPPWADPALSDRLSPIRRAEHFRTPQLLTHGERDFRVSVAGSELMFAALRRQGVPARLIRFPEEGHWIESPRSQRFWYAAVLAWFDQWLRKSGTRS